MGFKSRKQSFVLFGKRYYEGRAYSDVHREDFDELCTAANYAGLYIDVIDRATSAQYPKWRAVCNEADLGPTPYEQQL